MSLQTSTELHRTEPATSARLLNPFTDRDWDQKLLKHPDYSFFHSAAWATVILESYGFTPCYLGACDEHHLLSLIPFMEVKSFLTGTRGVSLPFTDECQPLILNDAAGQHLFQKAVQYGQARHWRSLDCHGGRELFGDAPPSLRFYTHLLDLDASEDQLHSRLEASVRRAIRKARESGLQVNLHHSIEAMERFYRLYCLTRKKHGLPPQTFAFFDSIHRNVLAKDQGFIVEAVHAGQPIAANVYFTFGKKAIYKYGASDECWQHLRGSNLVMWEAIRWLNHHHFESIDFGRSSLTQEGLRRFKSGWGADEGIIEYFKYDMRRHVFLAERDKANGWHNRVFRRLPVWLSRLIGLMLYRHAA